MTTKSKKMNGTTEKKELVNSIELVTKKLEMDRWLTTTDEGKEYAMVENARKAREEFRAQFKIGQLVWQVDMMDDPSMGTSGRLINRCNKIIAIDEGSVDIEMIYAQINGIKDGIKHEEYVDIMGNTHKRGEVSSFPFYYLEKHIAKTSGNVWWKVK